MFKQNSVQGESKLIGLERFSLAHIYAKRWVLPLILLLGLGLRLAVTIDWNGYQPNSLDRLVGDEPGYDNMARELLQGFGFTWPGRVPLYPIWLAGVYLLTNGSYIGVAYVQLIPGLVTIGLTYWLGCRLLNRTVGLTAAFFAAISYILIHQSLHLLSEVLYTPTVLLVVLALFAAVKTPSKQRFIWVGMLIGVSNLIRPSLLLFPFFLAATLLFALPWRKALVYASVMIVSSLLIITPWIIHNYLKYDAVFALQTSNAILWQGSPEYYNLIHEEGYTYMRIWSEVLYGPGWQEHDPNSVAGDRYWTNRAIQSIKSDPLTYLKFAAEKTITFWIGDSNADWGDTHIFNYRALRRIGYLPGDAVQVMIARILPIVAALGLLKLRTHWKKWWPMLALLAYFTLLHAATHAEVRLSEPLQPLLLVIIAAAIFSFIRTRQETSRRGVMNEREARSGRPQRADEPSALQFLKEVNEW